MVDYRSANDIRWWWFSPASGRSVVQVGTVLHNTPIPCGEGVEISFEQWQYGSSSVPRSAAPGERTAFPSSPANPFLPGVNHGYFGSIEPPLPAVLNVGDEVRYQYTVTNSARSPTSPMLVVGSAIRRMARQFTKKITQTCAAPDFLGAVSGDGASRRDRPIKPSAHEN